MINFTQRSSLYALERSEIDVGKEISFFFFLASDKLDAGEDVCFACLCFTSLVSIGCSIKQLP